MDFIFGTFATDELKLVQHRAKRRGIQHHHALQPRQPQAGDRVTLSVWTETALTIQGVTCYFTTDGSDPTGSNGTAHIGSAVQFAPAETIWDSLIWGYVTRWETVLPSQADGTFVRYRIGGWSERAPEVFADYPNAKLTAELAAHAFFQGRDDDSGDFPGSPQPGTVFAYRVGHIGAPAWAYDSVIYHVFVDRFYPGDGADWIQTDDLNGFCGGTLKGVTDKLSYLVDLGVNCIWLSPTWPSHSHHGYDAIDYCSTEARLGGDAALRALIDAAHKRGLRVLLDMACNHTSNEHPLFRDALSSPASRYRDWFTFNDSPLGYQAFFNVREMPEINLAHPEARDWMVENGRYWLAEFDIDGYRLDYANGPGVDFWSYFNAGCKDAKADSFCFGEVIDAPESQIQYAGRLDGCIDFFGSEALRKTFAFNQNSPESLARTMAAHRAYFPTDFLLPTMLDNHDMDRFMHIANDDKDALRRAAAFQMALPDPPIIYYGTEVGLSHALNTRDGGGLHIGRVPMVWDERQDRALLADYAALIHARRR